MWGLGPGFDVTVLGERAVRSSLWILTSSFLKPNGSLEWFSAGIAPPLRGICESIEEFCDCHMDLRTQLTFSKQRPAIHGTVSPIKNCPSHNTNSALVETPLIISHCQNQRFSNFLLWWLGNSKQIGEASFTAPCSLSPWHSDTFYLFFPCPLHTHKHTLVLCCLTFHPYFNGQILNESFFCVVISFFFNGFALCCLMVSLWAVCTHFPY